MPNDLEQHAVKRKWGVSKRQLERYKVMARARIADSVERNKDQLMSYHFFARRQVYARAMAVSDYSTALRILQDECTLLNLYPPKRTELTAPDGTPLLTFMTVAAVAARSRAITQIKSY